MTYSRAYHSSCHHLGDPVPASGSTSARSPDSYRDRNRDDVGVVRVEVTNRLNRQAAHH
ncbi:MAG: hypothetical protein RIF36_26045 [Imperialibacter sp.]|uniref:hypothetical protein n=1 Tax=Imperialibacter sp. TaxID=2038411 RepID=UPI0032ED8365